MHQAASNTHINIHNGTLISDIVYISLWIIELMVFILIFPQLLIVPDKMETTRIDEQNVGKSLFSQMKGY